MLYNELSYRGDCDKETTYNLLNKYIDDPSVNDVFPVCMLKQFKESMRKEFPEHPVLVEQMEKIDNRGHDYYGWRTNKPMYVTVTIAKCPNCEAALYIQTENNSRCPECGQKLSWGLSWVTV